MHLLKLKGLAERGEIRMVTAEWMDSWRERVLANLHNTDGRRVEYYPGPVSWERGLERPTLIDGVPILEKPEAGPPRTQRETAEVLSKTIFDQMLVWKQTNPRLFRRKLEEMQRINPALKSLSIEELEDQVLALCRKLAEDVTEVVFNKYDIGPGWSEAIG